jgi:hypothetical protein
VFSAGIHTEASAPDLASALANYLRSVEAAPMMRDKGLVPLPT